MTTFTELLPQRKAGRKTVRFTPAADESLPPAGVLTVEGTAKRDSAAYLVTEFPTGWDGRGFYLAKTAGGTDDAEAGYSVFVARNRQNMNCDCKGFQRHGNCKHCDAVLACITNGWL